eukprot:GEMP01009099.1.p1 GENE.GEMP01009099.1~~GEMP01009099.1.p1  ORF type:complete len:436 (+),score=78.58 GEMP01009099.1:91-1398(+)
MASCCGRQRRNHSKEKKDNIERDNHGRTVAHEAAQMGQIRLLRELKAKGVDLNIADNDGVTPVHIAAESNRWDVIEVLESLGVNLSVKDVCSQTPAHYGAWHGHKDVIRVLNKFHVPLNVLDEDKKTPAHYAARQGHCGVLRALFQINAQFFNAKDVHGNLPLHYASGNAAAMFRVVRPDGRENREPGAFTGSSGNYSPHAIVSFADSSSSIRDAPRPFTQRSRSAQRPARSSNQSDDDIYGPALTPRSTRPNGAHYDDHGYRYLSPRRISPPRFDSRSHNGNVYYEDMNRYQLKSLPSVKESERYEEMPRSAANSYRPASPRSMRGNSAGITSPPRGGNQYRGRISGEETSVRTLPPRRPDSEDPAVRTLPSRRPDSGGEGRYGGRMGDVDDIDRVRSPPMQQRPKSSPKQRPPLERQDLDDRGVKKLSGLGPT